MKLRMRFEEKAAKNTQSVRSGTRFDSPLYSLLWHTLASEALLTRRNGLKSGAEEEKWYYWQA